MRARLFGALGSVAGAGAAAVAVSAFLRDADEVQPARFGALTLAKSEVRPGECTFNAERPTHRILELRGDALRVPEARSALAILSYYVKEPTLQVERPYTPIAMHARGEAPAGLTLLVKRYVDGEVSRYLHRLRPGASVEVRGPEVTWELPRGSAVPRRIYMIVGGTGIATAAQLVSSVMRAGLRAPPRISVLYAAPSLDAMQLVPELAEAQRRGVVDMYLWTEKVEAQARGRLSAADGRMVDAEVVPRPRRRAWSCGPGDVRTLRVGAEDIPLHTGRIGVQDISALVENARDALVLVCGPDGFVSAIAGPRGRDLVSQGALGGYLALLGFERAQVFKL